MAKERKNMQSTKDDPGLARRANALAIPSVGMPLLSPFGLMRRFMEDFGRIGSPTYSGWSPALELFERDGELVVRADLPGLDKDDIKIELASDQLIISGERTRETEERTEGFYRSERRYGSFRRVIDLPEGVDPERVTATFNSGVLEITMPAPTHTESRRVEIRDGGQAKEQTSAQQTHTEPTQTATSPSQTPAQPSEPPADQTNAAAVH